MYSKANKTYFLSNLLRKVLICTGVRILMKKSSVLYVNHMHIQNFNSGIIHMWV